MNKLKKIKSILVTNTRTFADSTSIAVDLAHIIAKADKRVLLVDADLRHPILHQVLGITNLMGLSEILSGACDASAAMLYIKSLNLHVITGGSVSLNPDELLNPARINQFLHGQKDEFDKIIFHGPPFFYEESSTLAAMVDGVILMIHPGNSKSETSKAIIEKFQRSGATVIGIVMRNQSRNNVNQSVFIDRLLTYDKQLKSTT